jgi:hypothetical protein
MDGIDVFVLGHLLHLQEVDWLIFIYVTLREITLTLAMALAGYLFGVFN